jgi:hypothetical protein
VTHTPLRLVALFALVLFAPAIVPGESCAAAAGRTTGASAAATKPAKPPRPPASARTKPAPGTAALAVDRLESRHAQLLWRHRPDLAEKWAMTPQSVRFVALDEVTIATHALELRELLAAADTLPSGARADSLRARLRHELADVARAGALRRDALLWLDIVAAAARAPFALGSANGCDRTHRAALQLRALPEALRSATVLLRGAAAPEPQAFEQRLTSVERLLRDDLPARTEACKESRRRAEFVEADSLAAASLATFRNWLTASR